MYKSKLVKLCVILAVTGCMMAGCGDKKEETVANTTTVESSADTTNTKDNAKKNDLDTAELDSIAESALADDYDASPGALELALTDAGCSDEEAESYVKNADIDWYECIKRKINYEIGFAQRSEYDLRSRLEGIGYSKDMIDKAIIDLGLDFNEICYSKMYDEFNGRYPEDESELNDFKDDLANMWYFTDSQIEYAVNKLAENCK